MLAPFGDVVSDALLVVAGVHEADDAAGSFLRKPLAVIAICSDDRSHQGIVRCILMNGMIVLLTPPVEKRLE